MTESCRLHDDVATLIGDAVSWFIARVELAQAEGRVVHVALTGGSLSDPFHREVARRSTQVSVVWDQVHWWWGDERFVEQDSAERNVGQALVSLLTPLGVPRDQIHVIASSQDAPDATTAAERYGTELDTLAPDGFEVVLLGLGPDGHVASLFPGHSSLNVLDRSAVAEEASPKPPARRVSLTLKALNHTRAVAFMAAGATKAEAIAASLSPGPVAECPARGVRGREETVWFIDRPAAASLPQSTTDL